MPGCLLSRVSSSHPAHLLSPTQNQVDRLVGEFVDQATDWKALAAMTAGGVAYRLGRVGVMSSSVGIQNFESLRRVFSIGVGLATEVSAFELTHRGFTTLSGRGGPMWPPALGSTIGGHPHRGAPTNHGGSNLWRWSGHGGLKTGLLSSLITFGTLKGFGKLTQGQHFILQHLAQDSGMVLGHNIAGTLGITPKPEGSLAEQFLHAEATNLQIGAGMALGHAFTQGKIFAMERSMDLHLSSQQSSVRPANKFDLDAFFPFAPLKEPHVAFAKIGKSERLENSENLVFSMGGKKRYGSVRAWQEELVAVLNYSGIYDYPELKDVVRPFHLIIPIQSVSKGPNSREVQKKILADLLKMGWVRGQLPSQEMLKGALSTSDRELPIVSADGIEGKVLLLDGHHRLASLITLVAEGYLPQKTLDSIPLQQAYEISPSDLLIDVFGDAPLPHYSWKHVFRVYSKNRDLLERIPLLADLADLVGVQPKIDRQEPHKNQTESPYRKNEVETSYLEQKVADLKDEDPEVRWEAALALVKAGEKEGGDYLRARLRDENHTVRRQAAFAVGKNKLMEAAEDLRALLKDKTRDPETPLAAAWALCQIGDKAGLDYFRTRLGALKAGERVSAARQIAEWGGQEGIDFLRIYLKEDDPMARLKAAYALGELKVKGAAQDLRALLQDENQLVRGTAKEALGKLEKEK